MEGRGACGGAGGRGFIDMRREEGWKEGSSSRSRVSVCRFPGADRTGERERLVRREGKAKFVRLWVVESV